mmetsp:Transcript_12108/g.34684  ORF Transcript_12108/g.34684 Transcript_12108/m.34684 type:complete len:81 (-) Transcript_12108:2154-2396(-)
MRTVSQYVFVYLYLLILLVDLETLKAFHGLSGKDSFIRSHSSSLARAKFCSYGGNDEPCLEEQDLLDPSSGSVPRYDMIL